MKQIRELACACLKNENLGLPGLGRTFAERTATIFSAILERATLLSVSILKEGHATDQRGLAGWRANRSRARCVRSEPSTPSARSAGARMPSCSSYSSLAMAQLPRKRSRPWSSGMVRRSWVSAAGCCRARTIARTPFRRRFSSSPVGPPRSAGASDSRAGSLVSRSGRPKSRGDEPRSSAQGKNG